MCKYAYCGAVVFSNQINLIFLPLAFQWDPKQPRLAICTANNKLYMWSPAGCVSVVVPTEGRLMAAISSVQFVMLRFNWIGINRYSLIRGLGKRLLFTPEICLGIYFRHQTSRVTGAISDHLKSSSKRQGFLLIYFNPFNVTRSQLKTFTSQAIEIRKKQKHTPFLSGKGLKYDTNG